MDDIASLGIEVDSSELKTGADNLNVIATMAKRAGISFEEMQKRVQAAQGSLKSNTSATAQANAEMQRMAAEIQKLNLRIKELESASGGVTNSGLSQRTMWRLLSREISLLSPQLAEVTRILGTLGVGGSRLGFGLTAIALAMAAVAAVTIKTVGAFIEFERHQSQISNALQLTNQASGQTADGLDKMARRLAESGTVTLDSVREAQAELLKFKNVGADAFEKVLEAAKGLSTTGFSDMKTAAKTLAEALREPGAATKILADAGIGLKTSQQEQIDAFLRAGKVLEANNVILEAIAEKTKNLNQGADDLSSSWNRLWDSGGDAFIALGGWIAGVIRLKGAMDSVTEATKKNIDEQKRASGLAPAQAPLTGDSFTSRFDTAAISAASKNITEFNKAVQEVTKSLADQARTAGMSAVELAQYNETVAKGIGPATAEAAAIRAQVAANMSATEFRGTIDGLKQQAAASEAQARAAGMSAGAAAAYTTAEGARQQAIIKGLPLSKEQNRLVEEQAQKIGATIDAIQRATLARQLSLESGQARGQFSSEDVEIAQRLASIYPNVTDAINSSEAAVIRFNNTLQDIKQTAGDFAKTFVQGMLQGQSATEALQGSLKSLTSKMADKAIDSLMNLQFEKAAVQGVVGAGSWLHIKEETSDQKSDNDTKPAIETARQPKAKYNERDKLLKMAA